MAGRNAGHFFAFYGAVVIPKTTLKEEYEKRYIARGNTEEFLDVFVGNWDGWMDIVRKNKCNDIIELE